jgi:deoxyribodipyrimidine photo-lyase
MITFIWFRNDLRLSNNKVIEEAVKSKTSFYPIFILDRKLLSKSLKRSTFLIECLISLNTELMMLGSELIIVESDPVIFWKKLAGRADVRILASKDYSSYSKVRDGKIRQFSKLTLVKNNVLFDKEDSILNQNGEPYKVYTQFKRSWLKSLKENPTIIKEDPNAKITKLAYTKPAIKLIEDSGFKVIKAENLKNHESNNTWIKGGVQEAEQKWSSFVKTRAIFDYHNSRSMLDRSGTSTLSAYLKFGCISPQEIIRYCISVLGSKFDDFRSFKNTDLEGVEAFMSEIIWREFYKYILDYFPEVEKSSFQEKYRKIRWENSKEKFEAWKSGKTGYPIVDACMRQLNEIGWMHNRGRMIVASFLCKDLHIDWRWGENYFKEKLIDYDLSSNNGGWQWTAGVGTDAAPYFRIFNPTEQAKKFDPEGKFIKKWLPELAKVNLEFIFEPWTMPAEKQKKLGVIIGKHYPKPIVDHKEVREITMKLYKL